jgi:hypothetical protein
VEKKGHSRKGFFGETIHYDANGNRIGESRRNFTGGYDHFDSNGNKVGSSHKNFVGGVNHYDADGEKSGSSRGFWGQTNHYDTQGSKVGESTRNFTGGQNHYSTNNKGNNLFEQNALVKAHNENIPTKSNQTSRHTANGFEELLATVAVAGLTLFILGALLRWEDILLYFVVFIVSLIWFIIRNK